MLEMDDYVFLETATKVYKIGNNYVFSSNETDPATALSIKLSTEFGEKGLLTVIQFIDPRYYAGIIVKDDDTVENVYKTLKVNTDIIKDLFSRKQTIMIKAEHMSDVLYILKNFPNSEVLKLIEENGYIVNTSADNYRRIGDSFELYTFDEIKTMNIKKVSIGGLIKDGSET